MKKIFSLTLIFIALTITSSVTAQSKKNKIIISGFVKDSLNVPMKGVSIFINNINSRKKAKTNSRGYFKIKAKQSPIKIIAKSRYYGIEETIYQNNNFVIIVFEKVNLSSNNNIENFITKATSRKKKKKDKTYYLNMLNYLVDQPGVYLEGKDIIRIIGHGNSTSLLITPKFGVAPSPEPLFVIDGVVVNKNQVLSLRPNEVDSVSILKHGDAAIYGVQGANGVIKIRTKRG